MTDEEGRIISLLFDGQLFIQVEVQTIFLFSNDDKFQAAIIRPAMNGVWLTTSGSPGSSTAK